MGKVTFTQLVTAEQTERLVEACHGMTGLFAAILDAEGNLLAVAGNQDMCDCFQHAPADRFELDRKKERPLPQTSPTPDDGHFEYTCTHGLRHVSFPLLIDGIYVGTFVAGRFLYDDEKPDGATLGRIPVFSRNRIIELLECFRKMLSIPLETGRKNLQLSQKSRKQEQLCKNLRHSEELLGKIFESTPDQLHIIDRNFRILHSNWHGTFSTAPGNKFSQQPYCYTAYYGLDQPCEHCHTAEVFRTGKPAIQEKFIPRLGHVEICSFPIFGPSGTVTMVLEHIRDIEERKLAEEKWHSLFNNLPGGSFTVNSNYIIEDVNDVLCAATGYAREELVGQLCGIICPKGPHLCPIFDLGKERIDNDETAVKARDGRLVPIIKSARRIQAGNREIIVENFQDITDRKQLEEQLRHAQKMEAIGQLAGGVAHDFNNMLTAIIGYGNLLQIKTNKNPSLRKYVDQIIYSAGRAANLTSNLLAFSRKQPVKLQPVMVNDIIGKSRELLSRLVREDIKLRVTTGERCAVQADSVQIEQIMMNLVTNARDAMPDGGRLTINTELVTLDEKFIRARGYGEPGPYARISVSDTGHGIDEKIVERIFEPFFTTKKTGKGTGLGLAIVYGIIKQHNGYIDVQSIPGKGTTFRIYLPVLKEKIEHAETAELSAPLFGSETILLAEDDPVVRNLAKTVLQEFGYRVVEAKDGSEAVEKFTAFADSLDLLLFDVMMPEKNGREAYHEIEKVRPEIKALFMSGYTDDIVSNSGFSEENLNLIAKPFTQTILLKKVREVLDTTTDREQPEQRVSNADV